MILIITNKVDPHVDSVIGRLKERGAGFVRFNTEDFPQKISLTWKTEETYIDGEIFLPGGHHTLLSQIRSCWYRRPFPQSLSQNLISQQSREFASNEIEAFTKGLWTYLSDRFWINYPLVLRQAESKINNLKIASDLGFFIPRTIVTNDPKEALEFINRCNGNIINKVLGKGHVEYQRDYYFVYTHRVSSKDISDLENVKYAPTLLQEYVPKAVEIRTTVVGSEVFSCEIHSQESGKTLDDWRHYDFDNVKHAIHRLPSSVNALCLKMAEIFNLKFATFDFILTPDNRYVFLEINPNGQWLWIEQLTGLPISQAVADLLVSGEQHGKI